MLEHIDDFLRRHPRLADQRNADNQCRIATDAVVEELRAKGIRARAIWVRGHRTKPENPAPRATRKTADNQRDASE